MNSLTVSYSFHTSGLNDASMLVCGASPTPVSPSAHRHQSTQRVSLVMSIPLLRATYASRFTPNLLCVALRGVKRSSRSLIWTWSKTVCLHLCYIVFLFTKRSECTYSAMLLYDEDEDSWEMSWMESWIDSFNFHLGFRTHFKLAGLISYILNT